MERRVKCVMDKYCKNKNDPLEAFILTGAEPSDTNELECKVNIPKTLWTAFCCRSKEPDKWVAGAHWGDNVKDGHPLTPKTVEELNEKFKFELFPEQCLKFSLEELTKMFRDKECSKTTRDCDEDADEQPDEQPDKQPDKQPDIQPDIQPVKQPDKRPRLRPRVRPPPSESPERPKFKLV